MAHRNSGFTHEKWWFSIVTLIYQRVPLWKIMEWREKLGWWNSMKFPTVKLESHSSNSMVPVTNSHWNNASWFSNKDSWCCAARASQQRSCCFMHHCRLPVIFSHIYLIGGFNPPEKYESQLGWLFPIYAKIKNVPNHQPVICLLIYWFIYLFIPYHSVHEHGLWPHTNFPRTAKKWYMAAGPDPWVVGFLKHYRQLPSGKLT